MILILLGTQNNSFHRLLEKMETIIQNGMVTEKVVVQAGYTKFESEYMEIFDFLPKEEIENYQQEADLIICHGGVGSIISSLQKGKKVIAVPRYHQYGEHVNDHQLEMVTLLDEKKYIIGITNVEQLDQAIEKSKTFEPTPYQSNHQKMLDLIENLIDSL